MPRYTESREKFPVHIELQLSEEQNRRARALATHWKVKRSAAIRRCIDTQYLLELPSNSTDQTKQPGDQS